MQAKWRGLKPQAIALALGLLVGPFIATYAGWTVTSSTAKAQARAGIVEQLASFCDIAARATVENPGKLDWSARGELAKKWAVMPGSASAEWDVTSACERKLAS
jgi:hypothetical protein